MNRFYFFLWFNWAKSLTLYTLGISGVISMFITLVIYVMLGFRNLQTNVLSALVDVFSFYFTIVFSLVLLLMLFRSIKQVFNHCINGYELKLLQCGTTNTIDEIGYGDLVKVWRKWFMLLIWLVAIFMIITLFSFFNIYALFGFILIAGYLSFIILIARCKQVRVVKC